MNKVLIVMMNKKPTLELIEIEDVGLEFKQRIIGGRIDCISFTPDIDIWIHDEGLYIDSFTPTILFTADHKHEKIIGGIKGTCIITGLEASTGRSIGLSEEQIELIKTKLKKNIRVKSNSDSKIYYPLALKWED
ncbi:DUF3846 domain-containing protein [Alkalicoccobacillus gibsonii]|uniref:DUF3846 domain-containing protein n=1 Tax=Alkalicoccobacillus gibsonii TaxID=79881 RepID=A0ABU9VRS8_9BACI